MTNRLTVRHVNQMGSKSNEVFRTTLTADLDSDTAVAVDSWARQFVALSTDTYTDTEIESTQSINEKIMEGEG